MKWHKPEEFQRLVIASQLMGTKFLKISQTLLFGPLNMALHIPLVRQVWQLVMSEKRWALIEINEKQQLIYLLENIVLRSVSTIRAPTTEKL